MYRGLIFGDICYIGSSFGRNVGGSLPPQFWGKLPPFFWGNLRPNLGGNLVRGDFSRRHTAHFVPTPPAILRKIPPIKSINIPNALIQSSKNDCINPFTPQLLVTLLIHNAFSIHYGYTLMFSLLKILDRHRTTTNRHDRLPASPRLLSFDIVCAD